MSVNATNPTGSSDFQVVLEWGQWAKEWGQSAKECTDAPLPCLGNIALYAGTQLGKFLTFPMAKWAAYKGTNFFAEGTYDLVHWTAKQALFNTNWLVNKAGSYLGAQEVDFLVPARKLQNVALEKFNLFEQSLTDSLSPNATAIYNEKLADYELVGKIFEPQPEKFSAIKLIAPAIFAAYCARKSMENVGNALHHLKLLVSLKRNEVATTIYPNPINNMKGSADVAHTVAFNYTAGGLAMDTAMESLFAAAWAAGTYVTTEAIYDALKAAEVKDAEWMAQAILVAAITAPTILRWVKEAYYYTPPSETAHFGAGPALPAGTREAINELSFNPEDQTQLNPYAPSSSRSQDSDADE